jgi:hypothetical protein
LQAESQSSFCLAQGEHSSSVLNSLIEYQHKEVIQRSEASLQYTRKVKNADIPYPLKYSAAEGCHFNSGFLIHVFADRSPIKLRNISVCLR